MQTPTLGRIVRHVNEHGVHRPAIIVDVHSETCVNLQVFTDGPNDGQANVVWQASIDYDAGEGPNSWHWPPRA